jgi:uncharacterized protein
MLLGELLEGMNPAWRDRAIRLSKHTFRRPLHAQLVEQLLSSERRAAVLLGPRQIGKTVLLRQVADHLMSFHGLPAANVTFFDFSDERFPTNSVSPREVVSFLPTGCDPAKPRFFLFDEISKYTRWAEWLKQAVDHGHGRFLVSDSVSTLLHKGGRESGLGRFAEYPLEAFSLTEFLGLLRPSAAASEGLVQNPQFLERYLTLGGRPAFATTDSILEARARIRDDIADKAVRHDLLSHDVDVERVRDLLVYLIDDSGEIFNPEKRLRLLHRWGAPLDPRTLQKWIELLVDTMLVTPLFPYAKAPTGKLSARAHPKLYASDHGLVTAFSALLEPMKDPKVLGQVYEAAVFRHLREAARTQRLQISYWRPRPNSFEIDFVVHNGSVEALIEVTAAHDPREKMEKLRLASKGLSAKRRVVVYGGRDERREGEIHLAPLDSFLLDPSFWIGGA